MRIRLARAVLVSLLVAALFGSSATPAHAASRWTYESGNKYLTVPEQQQISRTWAGLAYGASPACAEQILANRIPNIVVQAWLGTLQYLMGADDGCTVAKKAAFVAARLWIGSHTYKNTAYYRMRVYHQDRTLAPDLCHVFVNVRGNWVLGGKYPAGTDPLKYWAVQGCLGE